MSSQWVIVYSAAGQLQGSIIKGLLEAAGIPVYLAQEGAGAAYGLTVGPLGLVEIQVPSERAAEAEALLRAMERGELDSPEDLAPAPDSP